MVVPEVVPVQHEKSELAKTVCGLRKKPFFGFIALAVVAIAAVVGGTVGGVMAARKQSHADSKGVYNICRQASATILR